MDYIDLLKKIDQGNLSSINLVHSIENYLLDLVLDSLVASMDESFLDFNYQRYDFEKADLDELLSSLETLPVFSDKKLIVIDNMPLDRDKLKRYKFKLDSLERTFEDFNPSTVLVMVYRGEKLFKGRFVKKADKHGDLITIKKLNKSQLTSFIVKYFAKNQRRLSQADAAFIGEKTSYLDKDSSKSLYDVENELEKLVSNLSSSSLTREMIEYTMIDSYDENIFSFLDALSSKDLRRAVDLYPGLTQDEEDYFKLYYMLLRQVRNLICVKESIRKRITKATGVKYCGLHSFEYDKLVKFSRNFSMEELIELHSLAYDIEKGIKTSSIDLASQIELFMIKMAS